MSALLLDLREENFDDSINKGLSLIDFYAPWCGPCKAQKPVLESIAEEMEHKIQVAKVNVDNCPNLASKHRIMSLPTLIIFNEGKEVKRLIGLQRKEDLNAALSRYWN